MAFRRHRNATEGVPYTTKRIRSGPISRVLSAAAMPSRDGHFSRSPITRRLEQPTRKSIAGRIGPPAGACATSGCSLFGLAPGGVCLARPVTRPAGELLPHRFTLTERVRGRTRRFAFCCTFPGLATGGRYPPPYPAEPGLSSRHQSIHRSRSTDGWRPSGPLRIRCSP